MMSWKLFSKKTRIDPDAWNIRTMFGPNLNFAVTEAYKLLRTNIMFSLPEEGDCHVIGVTSSIQSEGKSSTACNLAYALAETGNKVLLLEGDLRRPTLASKMGLAKTPGISNLLVSNGEYHEAIQQCSLAPQMDILTSGDIPPNPSELLSSNRMVRLMEQLKSDYQYIIFDLPPVAAVADALAVAKLLDGIVMVVRAGVTDQQFLSDAMRQLELVNLRILGFVYRESGSNNPKYSNRCTYEYGKHYNYDGRK